MQPKCAMSSEKKLWCFRGCCTSRWIRPMDFYGKHLSKCGRNKRLLKHWVRRDAGKAREGNLSEEMSGFPLRCAECKGGWRRGGEEKRWRIDGSQSGQDSGGDSESLAWQAVSQWRQRKRSLWNALQPETMWWSAVVSQGRPPPQPPHLIFQLWYVNNK